MPRERKRNHARAHAHAHAHSLTHKSTQRTRTHARTHARARTHTHTHTHRCFQIRQPRVGDPPPEDDSGRAFRRACECIQRDDAPALRRHLLLHLASGAEPAPPLAPQVLPLAPRAPPPRVSGGGGGRGGGGEGLDGLREPATGLGLLHVAAARGSEAAAACLLELRADPNGRTAAGRTPLHHAAEAPAGPSRARCVSLLLAAGADTVAADAAGASGFGRLAPVHCGSGFEWRDDPGALYRFAWAARAGAGAGYHRRVVVEAAGVAAEGPGGPGKGGRWRAQRQRRRERLDSLE